MCNIFILKISDVSLQYLTIWQFLFKTYICAFPNIVGEHIYRREKIWTVSRILKPACLKARWAFIEIITAH